MYKDNMTLEEHEVYDMKQYARKKNQRFKRECAIIDSINASLLDRIEFTEYNCLVIRESVTKYLLYHNDEIDKVFTYTDDLAEYIVANY